MPQFILDDSGKSVQLSHLIGGEKPALGVTSTEINGNAINILTAATTVVKSAPGHLHNLLAVGGTMGNVTVYDGLNTSGVVLWGPGTPAAGARILENIEFGTGLTIVTAAASFLSGSYR